MSAVSIPPEPTAPPPKDPPKPKSKRLSLNPLTLLAAPAAIYMVVAFAIPLLLLLIGSFRGETGFTLQTYVTFFSDPYSATLIWNTLRIAILTTLISFLVGYPAAFALAQSGGALQSFLIAAMFLPLSLGVVVKTFGLTILLRSDGAINQLLLLLGLTSEPIRFIFTEKGLLLGIVNVFLPFMILPIFSVVKLLDPRLEDAATTLGAGPVRRFFKVTLPLTMPGIISGVALVFSLSIAAYVIPTLLVGDQFQTMSIAIARSYLFVRNEALGSTVSVILLAMAVVIVVVSTWLARDARDA